MTRLLLTLLALFTGLVASGASAEVRVRGGDEAVAAGTCGAVFACERVATTQQAARVSARPARMRAEARTAAPEAAVPARAPTVFLSADRARE